MGEGAPAICNKPEVMTLGRESRTETSHESVVESQELQGEGVDDPDTKDSVGALFLRAGGLEAIRGPDNAEAFFALTTLHDIIHTEPAYDLTGIMDVLVDTLEHESPFRVAAAAAALRRIAEYSDKARELIQDSGAVPALVGVIKRRPPSLDLENEAEIFRRPVYNCHCDCRNKTLRFNDPTILAVVCLSAAAPYSQQMLDSFLDAGGVSALIHLLRESRCPRTVGYTAELIKVLLEDTCPSRTPDLGQEVSAAFFHAGLCRVGVPAFRIQDMRMRKEVLRMLTAFFSTLSKRFRPAAIEELVAGKGVELTVCILIAGGADMVCPGLALLLTFRGYSESRERMYTPGIASQIMHCCAKWLQEANQGHVLQATTQLLSSILLHSPDPVPAAVKANVTPGLVRALHKILEHPDSVKSVASDLSSALSDPVHCLFTIMRDRNDDPAAAWKPLVETGIVPLLSKLITLGHEKSMGELVYLGSQLVEVTPRGAVRQCLGRLPRVIADLITARPPVAPSLAAFALFYMALKREELLADYRSWGMGASLKRLSKHKDPEIAIAAEQLLLVINKGKDVAEADLWKRVRSGELILTQSWSEEVPTLDPECFTGSSLSQDQGGGPPRPDQPSGPHLSCYILGNETRSAKLP